VPWTNGKHNKFTRVKENESFSQILSNSLNVNSLFMYNQLEHIEESYPQLAQLFPKRYKIHCIKTNPTQIYIIYPNSN